MEKYKTILWDFDGVILDSMAVRDWGFQKIFEDFSKQKVDQLIKYHRLNGGLSRYVKIRYFFEKILKKEITEEEVMQFAESFSKIMRQELTNPKNLIQETIQFIKSNHTGYNFHIVSGSDQNELRFLCEELKLSPYFKSIQGSPTPKKELVSNLLSNYSYNIEKTCLIGDSLNDYDAAKHNNILFFGYNNTELKQLEQPYIHSFKDFSI